MRKAFSVLLVLALLFTALPLNVSAAGDEIIPNDQTGIPDKALYQAILSCLNKDVNEFLQRMKLLI